MRSNWKVITLLPGASYEHRGPILFSSVFIEMMTNNLPLSMVRNVPIINSPTYIEQIFKNWHQISIDLLHGLFSKIYYVLLTKGN